MSVSPHLSDALQENDDIAVERMQLYDLETIGQK